MRSGSDLAITHPSLAPCLVHHYHTAEGSLENENAHPDRTPSEKASGLGVAPSFLGGGSEGYDDPGGYASDEGG